ncbi:hypothetical protein JOE48_000241 [Methylobacterium sp. PvR107]|nr:hypothetical protein [Methylobacterium sp. PvR107]
MRHTLIVPQLRVFALLRYALVLALLGTPEAAFARAIITTSRSVKLLPSSVSPPSCMHLRRKAFRPVEGWSVRTVAIVCKTVTTALRRSGNRSFTSMGPNKNIDAK